MWKVYHLSRELLVSGKFVGAFKDSPEKDLPVQEVYINGEKKVLNYVHHPLPKFITRKSLEKWEQTAKEILSPYVPAKEERSFLRKWLTTLKVLKAKKIPVGIANYLPVEELLKRSSFVVVYRFKDRTLKLCENKNLTVKPIADLRALEYLTPLGAFPETVLKVGSRVS